MTPEAQRVRTRLDELKREQQYYFFERVHNPKAFDVLAEAGAFDKVTPPEVVAGQELHYSWPPTFYLRNVVSEIPRRVAALISRLKTQNMRVISDFAELVERMPADEQEALVEVLCTWLDGPHTTWIWSSYVSIVRRLAENGRIVASIRLSRRVIRVIRRETAVEWVPKYRSREAVAEMGDISYDHVLQQIVQAFLPGHTREIASLLVETLDHALALEARTKNDSDYSEIWARNLDDHPVGAGAKEALTYRLFSTLRASLDDATLSLGNVLSLLEERSRWAVFRRMRLALLDRFGSAAARKAEIMTRGFVSLKDVVSERDALLAHTFPELDRKMQDRIWNAIYKALPKEATLRERFALDIAPAEIEARATRYRRRQWLKRLEPIGAALEGERAELFQSLLAEFPPDPYEHPSGQVWMGPESPVDPMHLASLPTSELLAYVENWRSPKRFMAPSYSGLARALEPIVEQRRDEFLCAIDRLLLWPPLYIAHVIDALRKHVSEDAFDVSAFVRLLKYTSISRAAYATGRFTDWDDREEDDEPGDPWISLGTMTAFAVSDLLRTSAMSLDLRGTVWAILSDLLTDQDPTPDDDERYTQTEPWNRALNCVRGAAMLATFDYARWLYRTHGGDAAPPDMMMLAPELFQELDARLDPSLEPSPSVRAAYGQNLVSIFAISRQWTIPNLPRFFDGPKEVSDAGWRSYLAFNAIYDETYGYLRRYYAEAVERMQVMSRDDDDDDNSSASSASSALGAHLMRLYARGLTELEEPQGLLTRFLQVASPKALRAAIQSAGSSLSSPDVTRQIWSRFERLFGRLIEIVADRQPEERQEALEPFGLWVLAPTVDAHWAVEALIQTLRLTAGQIAVEPGVIEWLARISATEPLRAVTALYELVNQYAPFMTYPDEHVRVLLVNAVSHGGDALQMANRVDERLALLGVHKFRDVFDLRKSEFPEA